MGSIFFVAIFVLSTILGFRLLASLRWSQRQSNFIASVSHELNSPLSSIKLFAQTLRKNTLSTQERAAFVGKILIDADRLSHIIANILRAQEVDRRGDELSVTPGEVELRAYLREYIEHTAAVHAAHADITLNGSEAWVEIDPQVFKQVLDNLIDNAVRFRGKERAKVELRIVSSGRWVELQVTDWGIGIPRTMLERVFERFYRVEGGERETGRRGMGIGLNVVRAIVHSHGGTVGARSDGPGQGTTIWIRLPAVVHAEVPA